VLDIGLPQVDGYELARRMRARCTTRLIALSGYGQAADKARATDAGFDAHLVKPIALEALEAAIDALTARPS
jgi:DNA-binding response OmpR family regulator